MIVSCWFELLLKLLKVDKKQINSQKQQKNSQNLAILTVLLEAPPGIGPGIEVLQTFALPLGHGAVQLGTGSVSLFRILFKSRIVRYCF